MDLLNPSWLRKYYSFVEGIKRCQNERDYVLECVQKKYDFLAVACVYFGNDREMIQNDREIIFTAIKQNSHALQYASTSLKNDREIVMTAIRKDPYGLQYASQELRNDKEIAILAIKNGSYAISFLSEELRNDRYLAFIAMKRSEQALQFLHKSLRNDKRFAVKAVKKYGYMFFHVSERLQNHRKIVLASILENDNSYLPKNKDILYILSKDMRRDRHFLIVLQAFQILIILDKIL